MSEFKLDCEQFLATTRQHFFDSELAPSLPQEAPEDSAGGHCGRVEHRIHNGK
ncbi:MAG: hypothetical protein JNK99_04440 [Candidatus Accumulibacter sp.]|jgi:hypothetical protein|uniref:hypothetical protein n=1 Tax=Accumulibacter sp. TaxID=2053492 RepID=UPI001A364B0C|nr:hypothetical protein [Accumulibacter sp.]MBL8393988.1 hypothetical protein [Accumulibacter sp.]